MDDGVEGWDIVGEDDLGGLDDPGGGCGSVDAGGEEVLGIADGGEIQDAPVLGVDDVLLLGLPQGTSEDGTVIGEVRGGGGVLTPHAPPYHENEQHDDHELCLHTLPPHIAFSFVPTRGRPLSMSQNGEPVYMIFHFILFYSI